eukprot:TRINITY_DN6597_c0_g1_i1.p1 TRINITY_DN6597_c0_g1~~TRINITY_DN6597_c0_g1_i1.p1  ORF type:complete len:777 (-),score=94.22 TRINITY_DN6597_c0_g1_i1:122-2452(-)
MDDSRVKILPSLTLHPCHQVNGSVPAALTLEVLLRLAGHRCAPEAPMSLAECAAQIGVTLTQSETAGRRPRTATIDNGSIVIGTHDEIVKIPIRFSEVHCARSHDGGSFVICVAVPHATVANLRLERLFEATAGTPSEGHQLVASAAGVSQDPTRPLWLFSIDRSHEDMYDLMDFLSHTGAIRTNISQIMKVDSKALGTGGCATVFTGLNRQCRVGQAGQPSQFALKFLNSHGQDAERVIKKEVSFLLAVQGHPSVIKFRGLFQHIRSQRSIPGADGDRNCERAQWIIAMDFFPRGDLFSLVESERIVEEVAKPLVKGILSALAHIHRAGVMHRDVKPENVLITDDRQPILTDFGVAVHIDDKEGMRRRSGSAGYLAPEILRGFEYGLNADAYSCGVVFHFILTGANPFQKAEGHGKKTLEANKEAIVDFSLPLLRQTSEACRILLRQLLEPDPAMRPQTEKALDCRWFSQASEGQPQPKKLQIKLRADRQTPRVSNERPKSTVRSWLADKASKAFGLQATSVSGKDGTSSAAKALLSHHLTKIEPPPQAEKSGEAPLRRPFLHKSSYKEGGQAEPRQDMPRRSPQVKAETAAPLQSDAASLAVQESSAREAEFESESDQSASAVQPQPPSTPKRHLSRPSPWGRRPSTAYNEAAPLSESALPLVVLGAKNSNSNPTLPMPAEANDNVLSMDSDSVPSHSRSLDCPSAVSRLNAQAVSCGDLPSMRSHRLGNMQHNPAASTNALPRINENERNQEPDDEESDSDGKLSDESDSESD